jgi:hypothetical protein
MKTMKENGNVQYALKYYYSNSASVYIFVTSVKVRTLLENTFENTVTVIVKVIIEEVREFLIPA